MRRTNFAVASAAAIALLVLAGCAATTPQHQVTELRRTVPNPSIVLMPLDVELSEVTVGGVIEPKAEWTREASALLVSGLRAEKQRVGFQLVEIAGAFKGNAQEQDVLDQLNHLHGAVGKSILVNRILKLPNKGERFDWSLGPEVKLVREKTGADYALFVFVRDSYASDARKAAMVAAAILGVGLPGGTQFGFASLVDLNSGDVVWFNQLSRGTGDLRTAEPAGETIRLLLTGFPK